MKAKDHFHLVLLLLLCLDFLLENLLGKLARIGKEMIRNVRKGKKMVEKGRKRIENVRKGKKRIENGRKRLEMVEK